MRDGGDLLMKGYVLAIAGVVLISAVVSVIAPGGKMGKFVKGIAKIFLLAVLVSPFTSFVAGKGFDFSAGSVGTDAGYLEACAEKLSEADEERIGAYLSEEYGLTAEAEVTRSPAAPFPHEKIRIKILDFGIYGQEGNIDIIESVQAVLNETYGCPTEVS